MSCLICRHGWWESDGAVIGSTSALRAVARLVRAQGRRAGLRQPENGASSGRSASRRYGNRPQRRPVTLWSGSGARKTSTWPRSSGRASCSRGEVVDAGSPGGMHTWRQVGAGIQRGKTAKLNFLGSRWVLDNYYIGPETGPCIGSRGLPWLVQLLAHCNQLAQVGVGTEPKRRS